MAAHDCTADTTTVKVRVSGELTVPLQLGLLRELHDPALEAEVMQEAIKVSVSERLGHFDAMQIELRTPHEEDKATAPSALVTLELDALSRCIRRIQAAYDHLLAHATELRELLGTEADSSGNTKETAEANNDVSSSSTTTHDDDNNGVKEGAAATRHAKMLAIVDAMLAGPTQIVRAAANLDTAPDMSSTSDNNDKDSEAAHGLLAHEESKGEEEEEEERYARLGYTRL